MNNNSEVYSDFIDLDFFQILQDKLAQEFGVASVIVDENGTPLTIPSNFTNFCKKYIRKTESGLKKCMACDSYGGSSAKVEKKPVIYKCHAGLIDFASPIIMENITIGYFLCGQVLDKEEDQKNLTLAIDELGISEDDQEGILEAINEIKVIPYEKIEVIAELVYRFSCKMSKFSYYQDRMNRSILNKNFTINEFEEFSNSFIKNPTTPLYNSREKFQLRLSEFFKKIYQTIYMKIDLDERNIKTIAQKIEKL